MEHEQAFYDYYLAGPYANSALQIIDVKSVVACEPQSFFYAGSHHSSQGFLVSQMTQHSLETLLESGSLI